MGSYFHLCENRITDIFEQPICDTEATACIESGCEMQFLYDSLSCICV
jgi:hypothetical protein